jgi:hypothetical protein
VVPTLRALLEEEPGEFGGFSPLMSRYTRMYAFTAGAPFPRGPAHTPVYREIYETYTDSSE